MTNRKAEDVKVIVSEIERLHAEITRLEAELKTAERRGWEKARTELIPRSEEHFSRLWWNDPVFHALGYMFTNRFELQDQQQ